MSLVPTQTPAVYHTQCLFRIKQRYLHKPLPVGEVVSYIARHPISFKFINLYKI